jgi:CspA family cold shock protein
VGLAPYIIFKVFIFSFMKGTVKWFDTAKGYGFVTGEDGQDVFVHYTGINGDGFRGLEEGQAVEYELGEGKKGPQAINVVALK